MRTFGPMTLRVRTKTSFAASIKVRVQMPIPFQISNQRLRYDAQRASFLNLSARGIDFLFQFVSMAILARLLTPADFGVFAMATPFVWILMTFGDLGLAAAVLQQRDLNEGQASAVFRINLAAGIAFGGLFLLCAPLLGSFYGDPEVTQVAAALESHVRFFRVHSCAASAPSPRPDV